MGEIIETGLERGTECMWVLVMVIKKKKGETRL